MDGELRPDADPSPEREERASTPAEPVAVAPPPPAAAAPETPTEPEMPPAPTAEENDQARRAYEMTADRLDTAIPPPTPAWTIRL